MTTAASRRAGHAEQEPGDHEVSISVQVDQIAGAVSGTIARAGHVLTSKGGLPLYAGLGLLAAADVIAWPVAAAAGVGYAVLRRWNPLHAGAPATGPGGNGGAARTPARATTARGAGTRTTGTRTTRTRTAGTRTAGTRTAGTRTAGTRTTGTRGTGTRTTGTRGTRGTAGTRAAGTRAAGTRRTGTGGAGT